MATPTVPFESLAPAAQAVVREVQERLSDMFDSIAGGPHLPDESVGFDDDRYALLLKHSVNRVNGSGAVNKNFTDKNYPWGDFIAVGCITYALMLTVIEHFIVSYTEQGASENMTGPYLSRDDYATKWKSTMDILQKQFDTNILAFDREIAGNGLQMLIWSNQFPFGYSQRVRPAVPPWYR